MILSDADGGKGNVVNLEGSPFTFEDSCGSRSPKFGLRQFTCTRLPHSRLTLHAGGYGRGRSSGVAAVWADGEVAGE